MDREQLLSLCQHLDDAAASDFSAAQYDQLIELHKALAHLKAAVENALIAGPVDRKLSN